MQFIPGQPRQQTYFATLEDQVSADNPVRLIDAFIDKLDLQQLGFQKTIHHSEGRPPYAPQVLLKLYLYGYLNKVRSSRKLERESSRNMGNAMAAARHLARITIPLPISESSIPSLYNPCSDCMFIFGRCRAAG